jgi:hypothetical protein
MRHRTFIATVLLIAAFNALAQSYVLSFPEGERSVLSIANAPAVLDQCSRETPRGVNGFWEPPVTVIETLEARLAEHLESLAGSEGPPRGVPYARQYIGFVRNGTNQIYGNFFPASVKGAPRRDRAAVICDGGSSFWGIVYDPAMERFTELQFNGVT